MRRIVGGAHFPILLPAVAAFIASGLPAQSPGRSTQLQISDSISVRVHLGGSDTSITTFTPQGVFRLRADSSALAGWAAAAAHLPAPTPSGTGAAARSLLSAALLRATDGSGNAMQLVRLSADAWSPYQFTMSNGAWDYSGRISPDGVQRLLLSLQGRGDEADSVKWLPDSVNRKERDPYFRPAEAARDNPRPRYPTHAEFVRADGEVVAQFIVGADGLARRESLLIIRATHPLFALSVRDALPAMRFVPATRSGRKVDQVVVQTFEFKIP
jgi:TonB family protein